MRRSPDVMRRSLIPALLCASALFLSACSSTPADLHPFRFVRPTQADSTLAGPANVAQADLPSGYAAQPGALKLDDPAQCPGLARTVLAGPLASTPYARETVGIGNSPPGYEQAESAVWVATSRKAAEKFVEGFGGSTGASCLAKQLPGHSLSHVSLPVPGASAVASYSVGGPSSSVRGYGVFFSKGRLVVEAAFVGENVTVSRLSTIRALALMAKRA